MTLLLTKGYDSISADTFSMTYEFKKSLSIRLYSFRIWLSFLMKLSTANRSMSRCFSDKLFGIRKFITFSNAFGTDSSILNVGAFGAFHLIGFFKKN